MTEEEAKQIADLLNKRNKLVRGYDCEKIMKEEDNYVYLMEGTDLIACAESKQVQWYQWEVSHVSVNEQFESKGFGSKILLMEEEKAIKSGAKILQCTIRSNNEKSQKLFLSKGYAKTGSFFYSKSGNWVHVYQKSIAVREEY